MHVSHSLIPSSTGRQYGKHVEKGFTGLRAAGNQQDERQGVSSSRTKAPSDQVVEGELIGKAFSFDTLSSERIRRLFSQQRDAGEFTKVTRQWSDIKSAIEAYTGNARLSGVEQPPYENALDVFA